MASSEGATDFSRGSLEDQFETVPWFVEGKNVIDA